MVKGSSLTTGHIGKIYRDFRMRARGVQGATEMRFLSVRKMETGLVGAGMARKCHRQKTCTHFIFIGEQFLGAAPGVLD